MAAVATPATRGRRAARSRAASTLIACTQVTSTDGERVAHFAEHGATSVSTDAGEPVVDLAQADHVGAWRLRGVRQVDLQRMLSRLCPRRTARHGEPWAPTGASASMSRKSAISPCADQSRSTSRNTAAFSPSGDEDDEIRFEERHRQILPSGRVARAASTRRMTSPSASWVDRAISANIGSDVNLLRRRQPQRGSGRSGRSHRSARATARDPFDGCCPARSTTSLGSRLGVWAAAVSDESIGDWTAGRPDARAQPLLQQPLALGWSWLASPVAGRRRRGA